MSVQPDPLRSSDPGDLRRLRDDFPILRQQAHGKPLVYLDSANTSQKPQCVIDTVARFYERDYANVRRGVYELSERATRAFEGARDVIVTDIYSAGEPNPLGVTGAIVADAIRRVNHTATTVYAPTFADVRAQLERVRDDCDVILFLGAGDIASVVATLDEGSDE